MSTKYLIFFFFFVEKYTDTQTDYGWTQTLTSEEYPPITTLKAAKGQRPQRYFPLVYVLELMKSPLWRADIFCTSSGSALNSLVSAYIWFGTKCICAF